MNALDPVSDPEARPDGFSWIGALGRPRGSRRAAGSVIWIAFIVVPVITALGERNPGLSKGLVVAGAVVFVAIYVSMVVDWRVRRASRRGRVLLPALIVVATALTLTDNSGWGFLFTYCAACCAVASPASLAFPGVLLCAALASGGTLIAGGSGGGAIGYGASTLGVGLLMVLMRDLRDRNVELLEARAELARTAVAQERERFARDLHDLLGHTLSVIALKAELAGRLLPERPQQAATEVKEVEQVARTALSEVRQVVSGYRRPTLDGELAGARMALSAAGIRAEVERAEVTFDPAVEAVLAWAVREGATNVIRHSGAKRCTLRISAGLADAAVEVIDDGGGSGNGGDAGDGGDSGNGHRGNGLAGLGERADVLRGRIDAAGLPDGGFRLAVSIPIARP